MGADSSEGRGRAHHRLGMAAPGAPLPQRETGRGPLGERPVGEASRDQFTTLMGLNIPWAECVFFDNGLYSVQSHA